ncbi:hypothetical protein AGMMS50230_08220 [Spirochaetia bacterium]|nr:hypothetical protein AGMMS50230_08220 [Spirochaetia bacterium]
MCNTVYGPGGPVSKTLTLGAYFFGVEFDLDIDDSSFDIIDDSIPISVDHIDHNGNTHTGQIYRLFINKMVDSTHRNYWGLFPKDLCLGTNTMPAKEYTDFLAYSNRQHKERKAFDVFDYFLKKKERAMKESRDFKSRVLSLEEQYIPDIVKMFFDKIKTNEYQICKFSIGKKTINWDFSEIIAHKRRSDKRLCDIYDAFGFFCIRLLRLSVLGKEADDFLNSPEKHGPEVFPKVTLEAHLKENKEAALWYVKEAAEFIIYTKNTSDPNNLRINVPTMNDYNDTYYCYFKARYEKLYPMSKNNLISDGEKYSDMARAFFYITLKALQLKEKMISEIKMEKITNEIQEIKNNICNDYRIFYLKSLDYILEGHTAFFDGNTINLIHIFMMFHIKIGWARKKEDYYLQHPKQYIDISLYGLDTYKKLKKYQYTIYLKMEEKKIVSPNEILSSDKYDKYLSETEKKNLNKLRKKKAIYGEKANDEIADEKTPDQHSVLESSELAKAIKECVINGFEEKDTDKIYANYIACMNTIPPEKFVSLLLDFIEKGKGYGKFRKSGKSNILFDAYPWSESDSPEDKFNHLEGKIKLLVKKNKKLVDYFSNILFDAYSGSESNSPEDKFNQEGKTKLLINKKK